MVECIDLKPCWVRFAGRTDMERKDELFEDLAGWGKQGYGPVRF